MIKYITVLILFAAFIGNAYAPDEQKFKVYVCLNTDDEDKTERDIIESHLKRELRALGDVVIVDEKGDWEWCILITFRGHEYTDGTKSQFCSISSNLFHRVPKSFLKNYNFPNALIFTPVLVIDPTVAVWSKDHLPSYCISKANGLHKMLKAWRQIDFSPR